MKSAVFYFDNAAYTAAMEKLPSGEEHPNLQRFVRYRVVKCDVSKALDSANPHNGETVLNSVLLEE